MRLIGRLLWLLIGLIYRLIVLVMFERWIPFPDAPAAAKPEPPTRQRQNKKKQRQDSPRAAPSGFCSRAEARASTSRPPASREQPARLISQHQRAFFEAESSELAPELAARLEGEHWLPRARPKRAELSASREMLSGLLRDRRAVRDALVLGAALGAKRAKP